MVTAWMRNGSPSSSRARSGDVVHALPVLTALRVRFSSARITWVINSAYEPLIKHHPDLNETLAFDRGAFKKGIWHSARYALSFTRELRRRQFDLVIDLQGLLRTGLMCLATGARRRIGFANAHEGSRYTYTRRIRVPDAEQIHAVDRYWRMIEALGAGDVPKRFHVPIDPVEVRRHAMRSRACPGRGLQLQSARSGPPSAGQPVTSRSVESSVGAHGGHVFLRRNRRRYHGIARGRRTARTARPAISPAARHCRASRHCCRSPM